MGEKIPKYLMWFFFFFLTSSFSKTQIIYKSEGGEPDVGANCLINVGFQNIEITLGNFEHLHFPPTN